jgi:uncharacterized protein YdhG (YjbR/CyaY superfamily)
MAKSDNPIESYIREFPKDVQDKLVLMLDTIRKEVPENTEERITYGIPTFTLNGNLVHFAGFEKHIGFYPTPSAITEFKGQLSPYKSAKGSVQFPLDKPLPLDLITKMVRFRIDENLNK